METKRNNSKKRTAVLDCLASFHDHPTADRIYEAMKDEYPSISLATVYRNLSILEEEGKVVSVTHAGGQAHYDARTEPHGHFVCRRCFRVIDIDLPDSVSPMYKRIRADYGFCPESYSLCISGICDRCRGK